MWSSYLAYAIRKEIIHRKSGGICKNLEESARICSNFKNLKRSARIEKNLQKFVRIHKNLEESVVMLSCIYYIQIGSFLLCFKIGYARTKEIVYRKSHGILLKWSIVSSTPNVKMSYNVVKIVEFHISTHQNYTHDVTLLAYMYLVQFLNNFKVAPNQQNWV